MSDADVDTVRVLHVDDDPEIVDLAATFLRRADDRLVVDEAESGAGALDRVRNDAVHCVVSDYHLPDMECATFVEELRTAAPGLPVILFTGRDREQLAPDLRDRLTGYLQKGSGTDQYDELAAAILGAVETEDEPDGGRALG